ALPEPHRARRALGRVAAAVLPPLVPRLVRSRRSRLHRGDRHLLADGRQAARRRLRLSPGVAYNPGMRTPGGVALAAALLFPAPGPAQRAVEVAERLYEGAGLAAQVRPIPDQFEQGLEDQRGKMPEEMIAALAAAGRKSFAEEALRGDIVAEFARRMEAEDIRKTLDWLDGLPRPPLTPPHPASAATLTPA